MKKNVPFHSTQADNAFTLIELLVVIAVIGVLMTLIFPAVGTAMGNAARTQSKSILRTIGLSINSYALERGRFPALKKCQVMQHDTNPGSIMSAEMIAEYGEAVDLNAIPLSLYDPKFADEVGAQGRSDITAYGSKVRYITHQWNQNLNGVSQSDFPFGDGDSSKVYSLEHVQEPSSTWAIAEVDEKFFTDTSASKCSGTYIPEPLYKNHRCAVFFDAHAESIRHDEITYNSSLSYP